MKTLLISPHDDDSCLFAAVTCARLKPTIMVVLDSYLQSARGESGCDAVSRAHESDKAHTLLGCKTLRLGLRDDNISEDEIVEALRPLCLSYDLVYAPALQGGNAQHDAVSRATDRVFGSKVVHYCTYTKTELYTTGLFEVVPTPEELALKHEALYCFESQLRVNRPHFMAVLGKSEWLMDAPPASIPVHDGPIGPVAAAAVPVIAEPPPRIQHHGLKKVFLQTQFGPPHPWTQQYLDNVKMLAPYGWYLKVFTPNPLVTSAQNIEIVPMTLQEFDGLIEERFGVAPNNYINAKGVPNKLVSEFYPVYGAIFRDYIATFDFWSFTNWDCVYGRLDHFVPDSMLETADIVSDDVNAINGIFTLMRNNGAINNLFREVPNWEDQFRSHTPQAFDEIQFTMAVRKAAAEGRVRFKFPPYFGYHSYDRLVQHQPQPNLYFEPDGALIERFEDPRAEYNQLLNPKLCFGREIMLWHFSESKRYPTMNTPGAVQLAKAV